MENKKMADEDGQVEEFPSQIHLGVINTVYSEGRTATKHKQKDGSIQHNEVATTTEKVARALEARYRLFSGFVESNKETISKEVTESALHFLNDALKGRPVVNPLARATSNLAKLFMDQIDDLTAESFNGLTGTVPTHAALLGINHNYKSGLNQVSPTELKQMLRKGEKPQGSRRPSFIDTGTFVKSIACWTDEEK